MLIQNQFDKYGGIGPQREKAILDALEAAENQPPPDPGTTNSFAISGKDDTAAENRSFNTGTHDFTLGSDANKITVTPLAIEVIAGNNTNSAKLYNKNDVPGEYSDAGISVVRGTKIAQVEAYVDDFEQSIKGVVNEGGFVEFSSVAGDLDMRLKNLPEAVAGKVLYYDPATNKVTRGNAGAGYAVFTAILNQASTEVTAGALIAGNKYYIKTFQAGDDFSNITHGGTNNVGDWFLYGATAPTHWTNGSTLKRYAPASINELQNTLGQDMEIELSAAGISQVIYFEGTQPLISKFWMANTSSWLTSAGTVVIPITDQASIIGYASIYYYPNGDDTTRLYGLYMDFQDQDFNLVEMADLVNDLPIEFKVYP